MTQGVIYLLTGPAHAARLVVSLMTLRRFYSGNVVVYTTQDASHEVGRRCAADRRLEIVHRTTTQVPVRKNSSFITKIALLLNPPFETTLYLDCDTLVTGDITELFHAASQHEFAATQFAQWITTGRTIRRRIERWRAVVSESFDTPRLVESALEVARPSVNGGVCAARQGASILQAWFDLSMDGRRTFICDEVALHLLLHHYPHRVLDCRFNNSPVYGIEEDVRIWHFHGDKHVRANGGALLWLPEYARALANNHADLATWGPGADQRLSERLVENLA